MQEQVSHSPTHWANSSFAALFLQIMRVFWAGFIVFIINNLFICQYLPSRRRNKIHTLFVWLKKGSPSSLTGSLTGVGQRVFVKLMEMYPEADIYTSVFFRKDQKYFKEKIHTSFIQHIPFFNRRHKLTMLLRPMAFVWFDFREYDIVISSSSAEAKGIHTRWKQNTSAIVIHQRDILESHCRISRFSEFAVWIGLLG